MLLTFFRAAHLLLRSVDAPCGFVFQNPDHQVSSDARLPTAATSLYRFNSQACLTPLWPTCAGPFQVVMPTVAADVAFGLGR